jgi:hypothetical protein
MVLQLLVVGLRLGCLLVLRGALQQQIEQKGWFA